MHLSLLLLSLVVTVQSFSGQATYFATGLGACGKTNTDSDFIVALNSAQYGSGGDCFKEIIITCDGKTQRAQITDECPTCSYGSLDMSQGLFTAFKSTSVGVFQMQWQFADEPSTSTHSSSSPSPTPSPTPTPSTTTTWSKPTTTTTSSQSSSSTQQTTSTSHTKLRFSKSTTSKSSTTSTSSTTSSSVPTQSDTPDSNTQDGNIQVVYNVILTLGNLVGCAAGHV